MRGRKIIATISVAITLLSLSFYALDRTAGSAIPRSNVLNGSAKSAHGDVNILLLGLAPVGRMMARISLANFSTSCTSVLLARSVATTRTP